jgi:hypothetical protein
LLLVAVSATLGLGGCNMLTGADSLEVGGAPSAAGDGGANAGGHAPGGAGGQAGGTAGSPCDGVDCGPSGDCAVVGDDPACGCDLGFHAAGLTCEADAPPGPCDGVACGSNAACVGGLCACNDGFAGDPVAGCTAISADEASVRAELVQIAAAELGFCEGVDNRPYMLSQPGYWCYDFVDWVYQQSSYALPPPLSLATVPANAIPAWWRPEPGDMIKFTIQHYGMVREVSADGQTITTLEGNFNSCVMGRTISNAEVEYYGSLDGVF